jgi:hypothetical protein
VFFFDDNHSGFVLYSSFTLTTFVDRTILGRHYHTRGVPRVAEALAEAQPLAELNMAFSQKGAGCFDLISVVLTNAFLA